MEKKNNKISNGARYDVITIGGATEDITFYTREGILIDNKKDILRQKLLAFEYGAKMKIDKSYSTFGGGAANMAVNLAGLGFRVASLIAIGDDERGKRVLANLKKRGVDTKLVQKIKGIETGFSFVLINPEKIVFSDRAANSELGIRNKELRSLRNAKWVSITSLSGKWEKVLNKVFSVKGLKVAWNPGHVQLDSGVKNLKKFIAKTAIFFVNKDEAIELIVSDPKYKKKSHEFLNNPKELLKVLKSWGPKIVVITRGKDGADAYDGQKFYHQNIIKEKKRVDTTGVGDAFNSSFIAGLEFYKGDIAKAMYLGIRATASVIAKQGAQNGLLTIKDLRFKI
ncbi:MAG: PfkB family carbohydrate kinase [Patescibacteria group bacterium]|nr:PfkB family carbohydrate kinase [Patescibacteria group bacterium]